jgi:hypothetical protein
MFGWGMSNRDDNKPIIRTEEELTRDHPDNCSVYPCIHMTDEEVKHYNLVSLSINVNESL